jgi:hypothetical protein
MNREQLVEQLQPIFDDFVDRIAAAIPDLVRAELVATIGRLTEPQTEPAKKRTPRAPTKKTVAKPVEKTRSTCGKCGEHGHNARTCGKDKNEDEEDEEPAASPTVVSRPPPLNGSRVDRFAAIEAAARARRGN